MKSLDKEYLKLKLQIDKLILKSEKEIARNYKKSLDELRMYMAELYSKYEVNGQLTFFEMSKYKRLAMMDKEILLIASSLYKNNSEAIKGVLRGVVEDTYTNSLGIVNNATGMKIKGILKPIDVTKTINNEMAGLKWTERVGKHRSDAIYNIQKEIKQGLTQGDSYGTMSKRLKKVLETDISKANTIVRTEGHRCMAQAKEDSFNTIEKAGVVFKKKWLSSQDERVRGNKPTDKMNHVVMNGVIVASNEDFILPDGATGSGPGLTNSYNDINCRCVAILLLE